MRLLIQRVSEASVTIGNTCKSSVGQGLLILVGIEDADTQDDVSWLGEKVCRLRIFDDENGVMNKSIQDIDGEILIVSQFTLHASTRKGNRPSYIRAAKPEVAIPLYEKFVHFIEKLGIRKVATGEFGADMQVALINDGPVTIWMDSKNRE